MQRRPHRCAAPNRWQTPLARLQYRTLRHLVTPAYLMSHLVMHVVFTLMMVTLYLGTGVWRALGCTATAALSAAVCEQPWPAGLAARTP
jgi:hypothetical protein